MKKELKKEINFEWKYMKWVLITLVILILIPLGLGCLIPIKSRIPNFSQSNDWIGFLGSYTGGILGGLCTLVVMYFTRKDTRDIQEENKALTLKIQEENNYNLKKQFTDELIKLIADYITDINKYFYDQDLKYANQTYDKFNKKKEHKCVLDDPKELKKLSDSVSEDKKVIIKYTEVINSEAPKINREKSINIYYILDMRLRNINGAEKIWESLYRIHNDLCYLEEDTNRYEKEKEFQKEIENLKNLTVQFIENYLKK